MSEHEAQKSVSQPEAFRAYDIFFYDIIEGFK